MATRRERIASNPFPHYEMGTTMARNAIMYKPLHSCCLACDVFFKTEKHVAAHIKLPAHVKNLREKTRMMSIYGDDRIRKVQRGYFCEYCNKCFDFEVETLMDLHINSLEHCSMRAQHDFKRLENGGIILKNAFISKQAWNGIKDKKCMMCDIEFDDIDRHITTNDHLFKMVQCKLDFGLRSGIFRRMDTMFQCLTCNEVFPFLTTSLMDITVHFMNDDHRDEFLRLQRVAYNLTAARNVPRPMPDENSASMDRAIVENLARLAGPTNRFQNSRSETIRNRFLKKILMEKFVTNFYGTKDTKTGNVFVIINHKFLTSFISFHFISFNDDIFKCELCQVVVASDQIEYHKSTTRHEAGLRQIQVVIVRSSLGEFVRELRPNLFHCGFCNILITGMPQVMEHFTDEDHEGKKTAASKRLREHTEAMNNN